MSSPFSPAEIMSLLDAELVVVSDPRAGLAAGSALTVDVLC